MCGICGIRRFDNSVPNERLLAAMNGAIAHRGPDGQGVHLAPGIGLAMQRLSIVDLVTGDQPIYNEDKSVALVYNGEIYNHLEVRAELERLGHVYQTNGDTESVVHAYEEYGTAAVGHFRGMFAFAVWDEPRQTLYITRDRLGEKPLYYAELPGEFIFASEIKALLQHPGLVPQVDEAALDLYLSLNYVPAPYTMFKGIRKLPAGHRLIVRNGQVCTEPYWEVTIQSPAEPVDEARATAELRRLFTQSVEERLMSDVPLGAYLSGGVDSTLVVGLMSRAMERPVDTYSVGFDESASGTDKFNTDAEFAKLASQTFKTNHRPVVLSKADRISEMIPFIVAQMDEPLANPNAYATYLVARQARADGLKVLLTGDGGDELFAGYERYAYDAKISSYMRLPQALRRSIVSPILRWTGGSPKKLADRAELDSMVDRYLSWHQIFNTGDKAQLFRRTPNVETEALHEEVIGPFMRRGNSPVFQDRLMTADLMLWLPEESNMRVDKSAMAASIETRAPFLSHPVVEFAAGLPFNLKLRGGVSKYLLKKAFEDIIPPAIAQRPKMGFASPAAKWLRGELRPLTEKMLSPEAINESGFFQPLFVTSLLEAHVNNRGYHLNQLWSLLTFQIWFFTYIAGKGI
jgi:asparagine synthase (glutamine-hydrolysing)